MRNERGIIFFIRELMLRCIGQAFVAGMNRFGVESCHSVIRMRARITSAVGSAPNGIKGLGRFSVRFPFPLLGLLPKL